MMKCNELYMMTADMEVVEKTKMDPELNCIYYNCKDKEIAFDYKGSRSCISD